MKYFATTFVVLILALFCFGVAYRAYQYTVFPCHEGETLRDCNWRSLMEIL